MRLTTGQIILTLVTLGIVATLAYNFGFRTRGDHADADLAAIERDSAATRASRDKRSKDLRERISKLRSGLAACDTLTDLSRDLPACSNPAAAAELKKALDGRMDAMVTAPSAAALEGICEKILANLETIIARC